jgi:DNA mismatch repair ATPase MutL
MNTSQNKLKFLERCDIDKINSSQVITGLLSVVKELVENALDANSTSIGKYFFSYEKKKSS